MRKIKKGIVKDFNNVTHRSKREMLSAAGAPLNPKPHAGNFSPIKLIPIALAVAILLSFGAILTLAENGNVLIDEIFVKIQNIFPDDDSQSAPPHIDRRTKYSNEFNVLMLDYTGKCQYYYRSVKDAVADYGTDLYYPAYEGYENALQAYIIYVSRGDSHVFQIEYARENLEICWIEVGATNACESTDPQAQKYESHGTVFYISPYREEGPNGYGGHIVEGVLDGSCYKFFVKTAEEGKSIADSLTKAE